MTTTENNVAAQAGDEPMREAFEAWLLTGSWRLVPPKRSRNGGYVHPGIQSDWLVWQAAQVSPRATADVERESCPWTYEEGSEAWASGCGELWSFIDGGPEENRVKFCQGCGKPVALDGDVWHEAIAFARQSITIDAVLATTKPGA